MLKTSPQQNHDYLAVGIEVPSVKYLKRKFPNHEFINLSRLKKMSIGKNGNLKDQYLFGVAKRVVDVLAAQGARRHRIYLTDKTSRRSRAQLGHQLGTLGLIVLTGKGLIDIERPCSFEPFVEIMEISFDFIKNKQTLIKLKGGS